MKTHPRKVPVWFLGAMFIVALVMASWVSFVWLIGK